MKTLISSLSSPPAPPSPSPAIISRRLALALSLCFPSPSLSSPLCPSSSPVTSKAFLDISIGGLPAGRITIGLFGSASPAAASRFAALASASGGPSFRRTQFVKIAPSFVRSAAVRSSGAGELVAEWAAEKERCSGVRSAAGTVGIVVRDAKRSAPEKRVVARNGRIEVKEEEEEEGINGTEIVIAVRDSPEMDEEAVAVGRVVEGMEVVEKIAGVSKVKDNAGSPYFRLAKLIGDKRAVVAERGFNRPYVKVLVTDSGLLMD